MRLNRKTVAFGALAGASLVAALLPPSPAPAYSGAFLSFPHQSAPQSFSGNDVVVSNRSYQGFAGKVALSIGPCHNVTLRNLDFAEVGGGIYMHDCTGIISIEQIRARNVGDGTIGSGHGNVIQLSRTWQGALYNTSATTPAIRYVKAIGGDTEDMISIYQSGGIDAQHPLVLGNIHLESPLPPNPNAWSSSSGTCVNLADSSGHDIIYRYSTALNCGQVGEQINKGVRVTITRTVVYGVQRAGSNVGISRYGNCSGACTGNTISYNRVYWKKASGSQNNFYNGGSEPIAGLSPQTNTFGDTTINPANLKVTL